MFVALVPAAVDDFGEVRVRVAAFEEGGGGGREGGGVVEEGDVGGAQGFVDDEVVHFVVLVEWRGEVSAGGFFGGGVSLVWGRGVERKSTYVRNDDFASY